MNLRSRKEGTMPTSTVRAALFLSLITILIASTRLSAGEEHKWGNIPETEWAQQPPTDFPHAPAIVLFDIGALKVGIHDVKFERYTRHKIFDRQAVSDIINVEILVRKGDDFGGFKAQTCLPNGKKLPFNSMNLLKKKISKELEIISFSFPGVEDGCIIELKYDITSGLGSNGLNLPAWAFQGNLYALESRFSFTTFPDFVFNTLRIGMNDTLSTPVSEDARIDRQPTQRFTWSQFNIPPLVEEPIMGAKLNFSPSIYFQFAGVKLFDFFDYKFLADWPDLAHSLSNIYDDLMVVDDTLRAVVDSLVKDVGVAGEDQLRRLYTFVREEITTTPSPVRQFLPSQSVAETLRRRAGNSPDKNILLIAMLQALKHDANPIMVASRDHARFTTSILNSNQFNYVLCHVLIGMSTYVLDAADDHHPFPYLPPNLLASGGLVLTGERMHYFAYSGASGVHDEHPVDTLKLKLPEWKSGVTNEAAVWLSDDGSAICTTRVTVRGYDQSYLEEPAKEEVTTDDITRLFPSIRNYNIELIDAKRITASRNDSTVFDLVFRIADFGSISDNLIACAPNLLLSGVNPFTGSERQFPIDFRYAAKYSETIDLHSNAKFSTATFPTNVNKVTPELVYSRAVLKHENSARIITTYMRNRALFAPSEYQSVKDFYQLVNQSLAEPFTATIK